MALPATAEALRHSLELIEPLLKNFTPPSGPFDPAGSWSQAYYIWTMRNPPKACSGRLKIQRAARNGGARLEVEQESRLMKLYSFWSKASIECAADRWATPRRFAVDTWITTPDGKTEEGSQGRFSAEVLAQEIHYSGSRSSTVRVAAEWTLDWTLLDALQRLPLQAGGDWQFDLVEDCDLLRPQQRLSCVGPVAASLGGKAAELYAFCQTGTGTLPTQYWLDQQHRLLFVIHYYRAFVLESGLDKQGKGK